MIQTRGGPRPDSQGMTETPGEHTQHEEDPWTIEIPDHPPRSDSPEYVKSRARLHELAGEGTFYGPAPFQDHHGGGLWLKDGDGWFLVRNLAGIEWSAQFAADPAKVDQLRRNAQRLYAFFPGVADDLGISDLLAAEITDADGIAGWTDSICNASIPLPAAIHTGVIPHGGGVHHYPTPITDIELIKRDDFTLFVTDEDGFPVAVAPVAPHGSGDGRVQVLWTHPASNAPTVRRHLALRATGGALVLPGDHPLAQQAFAQQQ